MGWLRVCSYGWVLAIVLYHTIIDKIDAGQGQGLPPLEQAGDLLRPRLLRTLPYHHPPQTRQGQNHLE